MVEDKLDLFKELLTLSRADQLDLTEKLVRDWNQSVASVMKNENVIQALKRWFYMENDERLNRTFLNLVLSPKSHTTLEEKDFVEAVNTLLQDEMILMLQGLSILEISLVRIYALHEKFAYKTEPE